MTRLTMCFSLPNRMPPPCPPRKRGRVMKRLPHGRSNCLALATTSLDVLENRERIDRNPCDAHLEMEVRSGTVAGRSHEGDRLSRGNDVARLHERPVEVAVERAQLRISGNQDVEAVATALASDRDGAGSSGGDGRAERSGQGDSAVGGVAGALRRPWLDPGSGGAEA